MLETVFIEPQRRDTYESEDESEDEKERVVSGLCALFIDRLRSSYQDVWLKTLAKVSKNKTMIKRILSDLPQLILPNFAQPLLLADFLLACLDDS